MIYIANRGPVSVSLSFNYSILFYPLIWLKNLKIWLYVVVKKWFWTCVLCCSIINAFFLWLVHIICNILLTTVLNASIHRRHYVFNEHDSLCQCFIKYNLVPFLITWSFYTFLPLKNYHINCLMSKISNSKYKICLVY